MEQKERSVVDTNIILLDANNLFTIGSTGTIVTIPETVVDEIDTKKSLQNELGYQAREFGRILSRANELGVLTQDSLTITQFEVDNIRIDVVASKTYPDFSDTESNIINDRKIISIAGYFKNCIFISNDSMCRIRAAADGIVTKPFKTVESVEFEFTKTIQISPDKFQSPHRKPITDLDPDYKPENYNYILQCSQTGVTKIGTVVNGVFDVIGKTEEKDLRRQDVNPVNKEQLFLTKALQDPSIDIVVCEALAGSGKTATAISNGIRMVQQGHYEGIMYIRASVNDVDQSEEVGFLPGLEEKFAVYLHPLEDTLDFIVRNKYKDSKRKGEDYEAFVEEKITEIKLKHNIQAVTGLGMRGRTFTNMYVIIDEVQNQSKASLQKMLTRVGKGCKVVLVGSLRQIDNKYITKFTSGLATILDAARSTHDNIKMHAVTLHKVVRSPLAEWSEKLFSK